MGEKFMNLKLKSKILLAIFCVSELLGTPLTNTFASSTLTGASTRTSSPVNWKQKLFRAIESNNASLALKCLDHSVNPNTITDSSGNTPLYLAVEGNAVDICKYLLEYGANPNTIMRSSGKSPLHLAVEKNAVDICKYLLASGANPNISNSEDCYTPLHIAVIYGRIEITLI